MPAEHPNAEVGAELLAAHVAAFLVEALRPGAWARRFDEPAVGDRARRLEFVLAEYTADHRIYLLDAIPGGCRGSSGECGARHARRAEPPAARSCSPRGK